MDDLGLMQDDPPCEVALKLFGARSKSPFEQRTERCAASRTHSLTNSRIEIALMIQPADHQIVCPSLDFKSRILQIRQPRIDPRIVASDLCDGFRVTVDGG